MTIEECRRFYAEEIRYAANIKSTRLIEAFTRIPRENFLGPGPWRIASADMMQGGAAYQMTDDDDARHLYHNVPVAIDVTRDLNNGQPGTLAKWIDVLDLQISDRVFHLGCGVGYFTAIVAAMVGDSGRVLASEVDPVLAEQARANLAAYSNVTVHSGDGISLDTGVCDAMLINAGVTHPIPAWLERLSDGGRMVVPLTVPMSPTLGKGMMVKITRRQERFAVEAVSFVAIYSCTSARDTQLEPVLGKAMATGALMKVKSARCEQHEQCDTCVVHAPGVCLSTTAA